jgi:hypothetical protein
MQDNYADLDRTYNHQNLTTGESLPLASKGSGYGIAQTRSYRGCVRLDRSPGGVGLASLANALTHRKGFIIWVCLGSTTEV